MPKINDINAAMEKKVDLTPFFGEDAFVTIRKMSKYQFSFFLNKNRNSYSAKLFNLMTEWRENNPDSETMPIENYNKIKESISPEETETLQSIEKEVDRGYWEYSILKDKHNFTGEDDQLIELDGASFFDSFSNLADDKGRTLNDVMIGEIVDFNRRGIVLGEQTALKSNVC